LSACSLYLAAITPQTFGSYHDDGIYVVTAKAMAEGEGYRIMSLPYEPAQTKYPPLYPFLLSLIWRAMPDFPANILPMMLLSVMASLASLALGWQYLMKRGYASAWHAILIVGLIAINWRTVILATNIYSELFYTALSIAALYLAERDEKENHARVSGIILGAIIGLAFLMRTAGITLLMAIVSYYIIRKQFWRALLPLAVAGGSVVAWVLWSYFNKTAMEGVNVGYYTDYMRVFNEVISELQALNNQSRFEAFLSVVMNNIFMLVIVSIPSICLGLDYNWTNQLGIPLVIIGLILILFTLIFTAAGFLRQVSKRIRLLHTYVVLYIGLHLIWPYSSYDRFLMPVLPFLLLFLTTELGLLFRSAKGEIRSASDVSKKIGAVFMGLLLLLLTSVALLGYGSGLHRSFTSKQTATARASEEDMRSIEWIKEHTESSDVLVCYRDPLYYLHTGRKATRSSSLMGVEAQSVENVLQARAKVLLRIINENNARYLIITSSDFQHENKSDSYQESIKALVEQNPAMFVSVFQSEDERSNIYRIDDPK
jgi:4-amino-4-deoxy-L-arabinose transferase-like glycosyltransferase